MVPGNEIPEHVLRFIEAHIDDVPQLETLLMMSDAPNRAWQLKEIAARNYVTEQRAELVLQALQRRGLVSADEAHGFRFAPANPQLRELVREVSSVYQANLSRIATFIHSKPSSSVKEFARAFDLKKDR